MVSRFSIDRSRVRVIDMLKKLFSAFGKNSGPSGAVETTGLHAPYAEPHVNLLYNLLFCDDLDLFKSRTNEPDDGLWPVLLAAQADSAALLEIANNISNEGRVRALAFNRLRARGEALPTKNLLGVIVEVRFAQGLDVLAAFNEGGVRYLNQSGKVAVFEGDAHPVAHLAKGLISAAQPVIEKIGPWEEQRLPPPRVGNVRLTFLVSDGLYFGEGPFSALQEDNTAGPILALAAQLLQRVTERILQ